MEHRVRGGGHARELLDRIGRDGNTSRGTAAECCLAMAGITLNTDPDSSA
jgi:hypothetical protein